MSGLGSGTLHVQALPAPDQTQHRGQRTAAHGVHPGADLDAIGERGYMEHKRSVSDSSNLSELPGTSVKQWCPPRQPFKEAREGNKLEVCVVLLVVGFRFSHPDTLLLVQ
jgi:hypothetical protein